MARPSDDSVAEEPVLRRLNGRPQACDSCRSRKVACDHGSVCSNCQKRAIPCVYTISDQSVQSDGAGSTTAGKRLSSHPKQQEKTSSPGRKRPRHVRAPASASPSQSTVAAGDRQTTSTTATSTPRTDATTTTTPLPPPGPGYLGNISYTAVVDEARNSLSILNGRENLFIAPPAPVTSRRPPRPSDVSSNLAAATREMCLVVLRSLPDPFYGGLTQPRGRHPAQLWGRWATIRIVNVLRSKYGDILRGTKRDDAKLEAMAREISANTAKPFDEDLSDGEAFLSQFCGEDLRWESLGMLFIYREFAPDVNGSGVVPAPWGLNDNRQIKVGFLEIWPEASRACLSICLDMAKRFSDGNTITVFLGTRLMVIDSLVFGDASLACWRTLSEVVATATYLGLHVITNPPSYRPSLASEIKRRVFVNLFNLDKVGSSYHGRPPLLGHRYASSPLPLDVDDEDLLAGGEQLDRAVALLDADGWNTKGFVYPTTVLRCRVMIAMIKDELIELALGRSRYVNPAIVDDIQDRAKKTYESLPQFCKFRDEQIDDVELPMDTLYARLLIRLEYLQCLLFAARLITRHGGTDDGTLLFVSFEIVRHVLVFWMNMDRFDGVRVDFLWMVMSYGAPGGGVLCMELLNPTLPRPIPYLSPSSPRITRSAIIQQLSLLVGFLGWVGPSAPNADLTASCKTVIQSVLDHTLNGPPAPQQGAGGSGSGSGSGNYGGGGGGTLPFFEGFDPGQIDFGFDLLGTFDWLNPEDMMTGFS